MQLSQNLFAEITGVMPGASTTCASQSDRRSHPRIAFDRRARIFPLMEGVGEGGSAVLVRDISVGGIGFLYADPISVGDEFVIRLFTASDEPVDIQCAARRCELSGTCGSQYAVGATFEVVLNRSITGSVAPESEMPIDQEPIVDQPAAPTIEQRFDQQCSESRLIRPIIRETRRDRWMAKPLVQRISRILDWVFWPLLLPWKAITSLVHAGEGSRIRHRLKSGKKTQVKKRSAPEARRPRQETNRSKVEANQTRDVSAAAGHDSMFGNSQPATAAAPLSIAIKPQDSGRRSLFTAREIEPSVVPLIDAVAAAPVVAVLPAASVVSVAPKTKPPAVVEPALPVEPIAIVKPSATVVAPTKVEVLVCPKAPIAVESPRAIEIPSPGKIPGSLLDVVETNAAAIAVAAPVMKPAVAIEPTIPAKPIATVKPIATIAPSTNAEANVCPDKGPPMQAPRAVEVSSPGKIPESLFDFVEIKTVAATMVAPAMEPAVAIEPTIPAEPIAALQPSATIAPLTNAEAKLYPAAQAAIEAPRSVEVSSSGTIPESHINLVETKAAATPMAQKMEPANALELSTPVLPIAALQASATVVQPRIDPEVKVCARPHPAVKPTHAIDVPVTQTCHASFLVYAHATTTATLASTGPKQTDSWRGSVFRTGNIESPVRPRVDAIAATPAATKIEPAAPIVPVATTEPIRIVEPIATFEPPTEAAVEVCAGLQPLLEASAAIAVSSSSALPSSLQPGAGQALLCAADGIEQGAAPLAASLAAVPSPKMEAVAVVEPLPPVEPTGNTEEIATGVMPPPREMEVKACPDPQPAVEARPATDASTSGTFPESPSEITETKSAPALSALKLELAAAIEPTATVEPILPVAPTATINPLAKMDVKICPDAQPVVEARPAIEIPASGTFPESLFELLETNAAKETVASNVEVAAAIEPIAPVEPTATVEPIATVDPRTEAESKACPDAPPTVAAIPAIEAASSGTSAESSVEIVETNTATEAVAAAEIEPIDPIATVEPIATFEPTTEAEVKDCTGLEPLVEASPAIAVSSSSASLSLQLTELDQAPLCTADDVERSAAPLAASVAAAPSPATDPVAAVEPIAEVDATSTIEPIATETLPPSGIEVKASSDPEPTPQPVPPTSPEILNVQSTADSDEALPPSAAAAPQAPQYIEQVRSAQPSPNSRPPVGPPRQTRRRARSTFHR